MSRRTALKILRSRWHIENTGFNPWVQYWNFEHVFRHTAIAMLAVLLLWTLAFNLLQLFIYRRLKRPRRPRDSTHTIRHIVEVMLREAAALPEPIPWRELLDTSGRGAGTVPKWAARRPGAEPCPHLPQGGGGRHPFIRSRQT